MTADPPPSAAKIRRFPVTALIMALILALAAPSVAFSALLLLQSDNVNRATMSARAAQGVDGIAEALERELRSMSTNLALLATSGWVEAEEYSLLHARATTALAGTDTYLVAVDGQNRQILNTRVPWGSLLGQTSDPPSVEAAIAKGQLTVSNRVFSEVAQKDVFDVTMPILSGESRVRALILTRDADRLSSIFKDSPPPPGWAYAVLDGASRLVSGNGPPLGPPDLLDQLCSAETPALHVQMVNGVEFAAESERLPQWGWRACVWTSSDQTEATISQRWRNFTIITLAIVVATIVAGVILGRVLSGGIRRAAAVGKALDAGGAVPEMRSMVREVDDVLGTLTRAARRRLQQEEDLKILLRETAHRAKNQIAIASALVRLSARSAESTDQLRDDLVARLAALGRSIDMMSASPSGAVPLKELAAAQLEPFAVDHPDRLELAGQDLRVAPSTAQSLGLVLHELATNAAKYGAWSKPEGKVKLDWSEDDEGLTMIWSERDGPAASEPSRSGFGTSLIEMMIERSLGGTVERDYRPTGLVVTLKLPARPVTV
jgi:two-component sensor histidine kinase